MAQWLYVHNNHLYVQAGHAWIYLTTNQIEIKIPGALLRNYSRMMPAMSPSSAAAIFVNPLPIASSFRILGFEASIQQGRAIGQLKLGVCRQWCRVRVHASLSGIRAIREVFYSFVTPSPSSSYSRLGRMRLPQYARGKLPGSVGVHVAPS